MRAAGLVLLLYPDSCKVFCHERGAETDAFPDNAVLLKQSTASKPIKIRNNKHMSEDQQTAYGVANTVEKTRSDIKNRDILRNED